MRVLAIVPKGGEEAAISEVKELLKISATPNDGFISFELKKNEELFTYCYFTQAALQVLLDITISDWLKPGMTFRVRASTIEEEIELGAKINAKDEFKVDLKNPQVPLLMFNGEIYLDFTGDISKRDFRVFTHRQTLKGPVAFCLLKIAGYTGKEFLLDPFARDGTILLEAAHYRLKKSVREFDWEKMFFTIFPAFKDIDFEEFFGKFKSKDLKLHMRGANTEFRDVNAAKKNAKIAHLNLEVTRVDTTWLDIKFDEDQIDLLVTYPPRLSEKNMEEFLKVANIIAKRIVILQDFGEGIELFQGKDKKIITIKKE